MIFTANSDFEKLWGISEREYYSKQYLTFEALEDGAISFNIWYAAGTDVIKSISYSLDDGETWTKTENVDDKEKNLVIDVDVTAGDKILWKGDAIKTSCFDDNEGEDIGSFFSSDCEFNAYGNIMSLLYEDDFEDKNTLNNEYTFYGLFYDYNASNECWIVSAENLILPDVLTEGCYGSMFDGCTALTTAPALPATTLANYCYQYMFQNCTSLTTAPVLPATTLTYVCYNGMFQNCSSLNKITMLATDISASICLSNWTDGVAETGTLVINSNYNDYRSKLNVPYTWTILNEDGTPHIFPRDYSEEYLTFEALEEGGFDFNIPWELLDTLSDGSFSYSLDDGKTWITENTLEQRQDDFYINPPLSSGTKIMFKGNVTNYAADISVDGGSIKLYNSNFHFYSNFKVYGNIMSLIYGDNFRGKTTFPNNSSYNFAALFANNDEGVIDVSNLILPAKTLSYYCYQSMFYGTELTTAPELPATTLATSCYNSMFSGCTSLVNAPELPATTLKGSCYCGMFSHCTSLTTAPVLPAITLVNQCYAQMFEGCTNLNYIKAMFTSKPSTNTNMWVKNVAATGTFVKNSAATWNVTGTSGVPTGWTVETV